jgi:lipooligosaccharide transport system ATP-binding protein
VEACQLVKEYGTLTAVDRIDFRVERGEAFGLLGPNGAGKSTTMRMTCCRSPLTTGRLMVEGWNVERHPGEIKAIVGVVPQENNLDPDLNVVENLLVYARYFRIPEEEARVRAEQLLEFMGLIEKRNTHVEALSGGMRRRLIVARALINNPRMLILDEPTTGLDPHARHDLWDRLEELRQRRITILLSTHYMEEAEKLCDRLIIMDHGKILTSGQPRELIEKSVSKFVLEIQGVDSLRVPWPYSLLLCLLPGASHSFDERAHRSQISAAPIQS